MNKVYNNIVVAMLGDGNEIDVVHHAYQLSKNLQCNLKAIHVNNRHAGEISMMMDTPKVINRDIIKEQLSEYLGNDISDTVQIIIGKRDNIAKSLQKHTEDSDLLVVGHRKMGPFKALLADSVFGGITNMVSCPVLVVQKN